MKTPKSGLWIHIDFDRQGGIIASTYNPDAWINFWKMVGERYAGQHCLLHIDKVKQSKTLPQLGYYYSTIRPIMHAAMIEAGNEYTVEQVHFLLKQHCGIVAEMANPETGELLQDVKSLASYSKDEATVFIDKIIRWAAEFWQVSIPEPRTSEFMQSH